MAGKHVYRPVDAEDVSQSTDTLLSSDTDSIAEEKRAARFLAPAGKTQSPWRRYLHPAIIHLLLFAANIMIGLWFVRTAVRVELQRQKTLPGMAHVQIGSKPSGIDQTLPLLFNGKTNPEKKTDYGGEPRPELDSAWKALSELGTVRVMEDELDPALNKSRVVTLPNGAGYIGSLSVFHGLHCVERIHHYLYKDHYYADRLEGADWEQLLSHTEHCVDYLRQYVQCNADMTYLMMHWDSNGSRLPFTLEASQHQCKDFTAVQEFAESRKLDLFEPGVLVHPTLGVLYDGNSDHSKGSVTGF